MLYVDGIRAFAIGYYAFYESAESVSLPRRQESGRGESGACIQGFLIPFCQSCIPAGMIAIYMTDGK